MTIIVRHDLEAAIRIFKRACQPILNEVKRREYFLTRTQRRKVKDRKAEKRARQYKRREISKKEKKGDG